MTCLRWLLLCLALTPLRADPAPLLTLETGGHSARCRWVGFTADSRRLVSLGDDKAVRVWDLTVPQQPVLERTLRFQSGPGQEGKLFAGALSPVPAPGGGPLLAVAGLLGGPEGGAILLVDLGAGAVRSVLRGHARGVPALAFSADGRYLASGSADDTVRVWELAAGPANVPAPAVLQGHFAEVYAVAFVPTPAGAPPVLVSGSYDHTLRLWRREGDRWRSGRAMTGHTAEVARVVASPDGRRIASSGKDGTIRLWDAVTGDPLGTVASQPQGVMALAWGPGADTVLAGGDDNVARVWRLGGRTEQAHFAHDNSVSCVATAPDGRLVASAGGSNHDVWLWDPASGRAVGHIVGTGRPAWNVAFSADGRRIALAQAWTAPGDESLGAENALTVAFDLPTVQPRPIAPSDRWQGARLSEGGDTLTRGRDGELLIQHDGRRAGEVRRDARYDVIRCASLVPGGRHLVVGSNYALTLNDRRSGQVLREFVGHTGIVWGVAVSPDGRYLVSGSHDQTVKLWNLATGELLLSLFVGSDGEWVAWTPGGSYASSPKGDQRIGWQYNRGLDHTADWVSGYQLRRQLYHPELIAQVLDTGAAPAAVDLASAEPPVVTILEPAPGAVTTSAELTVRAKVDDPGHRPLKEARVLVNGRDLAARGLRPKLTADIERSVVLVPGDNVLTVVATNADGAESAPSSVTVSYRAPGPAAAPALHLLSVGVSRYADETFALRYAAKDATDVAVLYQRQQGRLFATVDERVLTDAQATGPAMRAGLAWLAKVARPGDYTLVFFAGHGLPGGRGSLFLLPHDGDPERLSDTALRWSEVATALAALPGRVLLMLDACHSGGGEGTRGLRTVVEVNDALRQAGGEAGVITLASCLPNELSLEEPAWSNGAFTKALTEGLSGRADVSGDGQVTLAELDLYVAERVKTLTDGRQHPTTQKPAGTPNDLVLAKLR